MSVTKQFARYVTQNIFGMLGISCYIIADTFFIAKAAGTDGITVLNLVLPIYNLIFAIRFDDRRRFCDALYDLKGAGRGAGARLFFQCHLLCVDDWNFVYTCGRFYPG